MCGQDFYSLEDSIKVAKKLDQKWKRQRREAFAEPILVTLVVEPRGKRRKKFTVKRELERLIAREDKVAQELGLVLRYRVPLDVKWFIERGVYEATPELRMARKGHKVVTTKLGLALVRRFEFRRNLTQDEQKFVKVYQDYR